MLRFSSNRHCNERVIAFSFLFLVSLLSIDGQGGLGEFAAANVDAVRRAQTLDIDSSFGADDANIFENNHHSLRRDQQRQGVVDYELWESGRFPVVLNDWRDKYPDFIEIKTSQEAYDLPRAGKKGDCPMEDGFDDDVPGCPNYFFTIQDFVTHPISSESSNRLPEVFWSGALHGDERVGPTVVMEASGLLLEAAHCERLLSDSANNSNSNSNNGCRETLRDMGITDVHRKWLARLVATRRIVVAPTANALGHFREKREEYNLDPNRDFPYDLDGKYDECMRTIAGRTINEIFLDHMFQLALTYHGGMEVIAYEWGSPWWEGHYSPDDEAQFQIGRAYSDYGGTFAGTEPFEYGPANDVVYKIRGGMEDWAYASSWTPSVTQPCTPSTFGGYPETKTTYNNSTLRAFNILIESSDKKEPNSRLGSSLDILNKDSEGNGHVSRNIRLALLSAELVEPYASIVGVNQKIWTDGIGSMRERDSNSCSDDSMSVVVAHDLDELNIKWTVGGALTIDETKLWYAKWDDVIGEVGCWTQPLSTDNLDRAGSSKTGTGYFSEAGSQPSPETSAIGTLTTNGPLFQANVPLQDFLPGDRILVMASAKVDQSWKDQPQNVQPNKPPQSHIVNARTDPNYRHESNGKVIQGRLHWFSVPVTIVIEQTPAPTSFPSETPTEAMPEGCEDDNSAKFYALVKAKKNKYKDIHCSWLANKGKRKRKKICKEEVIFPYTTGGSNDKTEYVKHICQRTCGFVGLGYCKYLK